MSHDAGARCNWVYIAGYGRSGSTLVEAHLAEHCDVLGVGELYFLWDRGFLRNEFVASGVRFHESQFWKGVIADAFGKMDVDRAERFDGVFKRFFGSVATTRPWTKASKNDFDQFAEIFVPLSDALIDHADGRTIVDSSKYPLFGAALARSTDLRLGILHCFRNPAAVAHSWSKVKKRPEAGPLGEPHMARSRSSATSAWRWKAYSSQSLRLAEEFSLPHVLVHYEDFCVHPQDYIDLASDRFGLLPNRKADEFQWHSVSGNPARMGGGLDRIRIDTSWKEEMSGLDRMLVLAACSGQYARLRSRTSAQFVSKPAN